MEKAKVKPIGQFGKAEHNLVELKARVDNIDLVRSILVSLKAKHVGTFQQTDLYFEVPLGRLKLRQVNRENKAQLVYYERENVAKPRRSNVFILKLQDADAFKAALRKILKIKAVVNKVREVYRYRGTQIHLDNVNKLGKFVEFERKTLTEPNLLRKNREVLEKLMEKLKIKHENLESLSYGELVSDATENSHV